MQKPNKLDEVILLRIDKELKEKLEKTANAKERSLSGQIRMILKDYIERVNI